MPHADVHAALGQPGVLRAVLMAGAYPALIALIGLGLAALIRHTAGAISAMVAVVFVLPLILLPFGQQNAAMKFLPMMIGGELADRGQAGRGTRCRRGRGSPCSACTRRSRSRQAGRRWRAGTRDEEQLTTMDEHPAGGRRGGPRPVHPPGLAGNCCYCAAGAIAGVAGFFLVRVHARARACSSRRRCSAPSSACCMMVVVLIHRPEARRAAPAAAAARGSATASRRPRRSSRARACSAGWTGGCGTANGWRRRRLRGAEAAGGDRPGWAVAAVGMRPGRHHLPAGVAAVPQPPGGHQARPADRA